jgi:glycosyltransferase involved in cell wall biosynthesis
VKADGRLCYAASPAECSMCSSSITAGKFFVRETILKSNLDAVDHFVAPSEFLQDRYVAWGMPADRITVIENLLDPGVVSRSETRRSVRPGEPGAAAIKPHERAVFGYFAQINPFKGFDLLLEAAALLPEDVRKQMIIRVHGENTHYRDTEFHQRTEALLQDLRDVVFSMGAYRGDNVIDLMAGCDWVVVPSTWWENSPVVMQEARLAGCALICADIGGMAEKANLDVDYLFPARSAGALAALMTQIVRNKVHSDQERLRRLAEARQQADEIHLARHLAIYEEART